MVSSKEYNGECPDRARRRGRGMRVCGLSGGLGRAGGPMHYYVRSSGGDDEDIVS